MTIFDKVNNNIAIACIVLVIVSKIYNTILFNCFLDILFEMHVV